MTKKKAHYNDLMAIRTVEAAMSQGRDLELVLEDLFGSMETLAEYKTRLAKKPRAKK